MRERKGGEREEGEVLKAMLRYVGRWRNVSNNTYFEVI